MIDHLPHAAAQRIPRAWTALPAALRYLLEALAIFVIYNALAALNREFTPPPTGISPIWLPAGFAVGVILVRGWWTAIPLFLTGFVNTIRSDLHLTEATAAGGSDLPMSTLLWAALLFGTAVAGHSLAARTLVSRIRNRHYDSVWSAFLFLAFVGPVSSVVSALLGTEVFRVEGFVTMDTFPVSAFTFWIGDSIASILIAPVFIAMYGGASWRPRRTAIIALMLATTAIVLASTTLVGRTELDRIRQTFERSTNRAVAVFEIRVRRVENIVLDQATLVATAPTLSGAQFDAAARDKLERSTGVNLLGLITTPGGDIDSARVEYVSGTNQDLFRESFNVDPVSTQLAHAGDTGTVIWIPQGDDPGAVADYVFAPVYEQVVDPASLSVGQRRAKLIGFVVARTNLQVALNASIDTIVDHAASSVVRSERSGSRPLVLASLPAAKTNPLVDPNLTPHAAARTRGVPFASVRTIELNSTPWSVTFAPSREFVTDRAFLVTVVPSSMIALVMSLTIMLIALTSTGQRALLARLVRARTHELQESEHRYKSVVDNVREAIVQLDRDDRITFVSAGWRDELSHGGQEAAVGGLLFDVLRIADVPRLRMLLDRARSAPGTTVHGEFEAVDHERVYEIRLAALPASPSTAIVGLIIDMTEQREILRNRERFVSLVAHELRNPLTVISGSVATISAHEQDSLPPLTAKLLPAVQSSAHRLDRIISDLLVSSQVDAGTLSLVVERTDVARLTHVSIQAAELLATNNGVRIVDDVPTTAVFAMCDVDRVSQVVDNLLSNAIKYTPGGGTVHVGVRVDDDDHALRLTVQDTGIGIAPADRSRVFERFGRTEQGTIVAPGTGIGLSICQAIAEAHGGHIELVSELGVGSTFSLVLPLD